MSRIISVFVILTLFNHSSARSPPIAETKYGQLSGAWRSSVSGRSYASFEGIPFGASTAGEGRLQDPVRPAAWSGVRTATAPGSPCLQYNPLIPDPTSRIVGSEDCLYLNVHTPDLTPSTPMPVMVFIHGGGYVYGAGDLYGGANLMDRDIVFVTFNYRLGPLGFLSTEDNNIAGNMGLKDQAFALKWVQENIHGFGGDPDSVTLTGHSAGAASVQYQILSDLSKGTFHRAAMTSGSAFAPWAHQVHPLKKAKRLAEHLGCSTDTNEIIADCLRMKPAEAIVQAQEIFFGWNQNWIPVFTPSIESSDVEDHFMSEHPYVRAKNGLSQKIPLIISGTNSEGLAFGAAYSASDLEDLNSKWDALASYVLNFEDTIPASRHLKVAEMVKSHFFQGKTPSNTTFHKLVEAMGQRLFLVAIGKAAEIHAATTGQPTYMYYYTFKGSNSTTFLLSGRTDFPGACHGDDLFHIIDLGLQFNSPEDTQITNLLLDFFHSFVTNGVPTSDKIKWHPMTPGSPHLKYLKIESPSDSKMRKSSNFGKMKFWNTISFMENEDMIHRLK